MPFIHDDFLLSTPAARRLYHEHAAGQPILDYHNHLPPEDIASNRQFANLFDIWLEGDHYKWRAMRGAGTPESLVTGGGDPYEKFLAWARTVPQTLRNPLYHWTHLELARYFNITELLDEKSAPAIWEQTRDQLASPEFSARAILKRFDVRALCTTDDPIDDLAHHQAIAASGFDTRVYPTFRPDRALTVDDPAAFNAWTNALATASDTDIGNLNSFLDALKSRHDFFHSLGCRLSDHGLEHCYADFCSNTEAESIFQKARAGQAASPEEKSRFASFMMLFFGLLAKERGWTVQLHLGALRNANTRLFENLGPDIGCDSISDHPQAKALTAYLARLDHDCALPKVILYNLNPADNYVFASIIGSFQEGGLAGKIQLGSGWWHNDQKEAMEWQINALSNLGLLSRFVGMLTDSRSFMSFPRHEYFRRVLCNLLGQDIENGEIPNDDNLVGSLVENICYNNARNSFGIEIPAT